MTTPSDLIDTLRMFDNGLALAELLARHPDVPRRTMQRWIKQLAHDGRLAAHGNCSWRTWTQWDSTDSP